MNRKVKWCLQVVLQDQNIVGVVQCTTWSRCKIVLAFAPLTNRQNTTWSRCTIVLAGVPCSDRRNRCCTIVLAGAPCSDRLNRRCTVILAGASYSDRRYRRYTTWSRCFLLVKLPLLLVIWYSGFRVLKL